MPNEIKNPLSATTSLNSVVNPKIDANKVDDQKSRLAGNSLTVTVWTMAGVVLAACVGGGTRYLEVDGGIGGGGSEIPGGDTGTGDINAPNVGDGGAPTATPADGIEIDEDTTLSLGDLSEEPRPEEAADGQPPIDIGKILYQVFGFADESGNSEGQPISAFRGIIIDKNAVESENSNYTITIDGEPLSILPADGENFPRLNEGEVYINYNRLHLLEITPDPNYPGTADSGEITIKYRVYDGAEASETQEELKITVNQVNDLPVWGNITGDDRGNDLYVLDKDGYLIDAAGDKAGFIQNVTDVEDDLSTTDTKEISFSIEGLHAALFEIVEDNGTFQIKFAGTDDQRLSKGEQYDISIVATDSDGGSVPLRIQITEDALYLENDGVNSDGDSVIIKTYTDGDGLLPENADGAQDANNNNNSDGVNLGSFKLEGVTFGFDDDASVYHEITTDTENFEIRNNDDLVFVGENSGDYDVDSGDRTQYEVDITIKTTQKVTHSTDFTGQTYIDASGDATDADTREVHLEGGDSAAADFTSNPDII